MLIFTLDLEGVFVPEIWIAVSQKTGVKELSITTRDEPDYDKLMRFRLETLRRENIKLADIVAVIASLKPFDGAGEFLSWLRRQGQVIVLSDTFEQFARPLMEQLDMPTLFCHALEVDGRGMISGYRLRLPDQKRKSVEAFKALNYTVVAAGDSYNDLSMLRAADSACLYRPTEKFAKENSDLAVAENYAELKALFEKFIKKYNG